LRFNLPQPDVSVIRAPPHSLSHAIVNKLSSLDFRTLVGFAPPPFPFGLLQFGALLGLGLRRRGLRTPRTAGE
jgi:hypothetical protein